MLSAGPAPISPAVPAVTDKMPANIHCRCERIFIFRTFHLGMATTASSSRPFRAAALLGDVCQVKLCKVGKVGKLSGRTGAAGQAAACRHAGAFAEPRRQRWVAAYARQYLHRRHLGRRIEMFAAAARVTSGWFALFSAPGRAQLEAIAGATERRMAGGCCKVPDAPNNSTTLALFWRASLASRRRMSALKVLRGC